MENTISWLLGVCLPTIWMHVNTPTQKFTLGKMGIGIRSFFHSLSDSFLIFKDIGTGHLAVPSKPEDVGSLMVPPFHALPVGAAVRLKRHDLVSNKG